MDKSNNSQTRSLLRRIVRSYEMFERLARAERSLGQRTSFSIGVRLRMDHILTEHTLAFNPRGRPIKNRDWHR
jgi:hypothetical protein